MLSLVSLGIMNITTTVVHADTSQQTQASVNVGRDPEGGLQLKNVSPKIDFGTLQLDTTKTQASKTAETDVAATILDTRGTGEGWTLQVAYDASTKDKNWKAIDSDSVLKGAHLLIAPVNSDFTHDGSTEFEDGPEQATTFYVNDSNHNVFTAASGNGLGEWTATFPKEKAGIKLTVPSISIAGEYQATLDWTLLDAPQ